MTEIVRCVWTLEDALDIADCYDVPVEVATERVNEWTKAITDRVNSLVDELLTNVIRDGQP